MPNPVCGREAGTLYNFRQQFGMTNVYKDVKKNYKSAEHLMLCTTKAYICSAFMSWAGLENLDDIPTSLQVPSVHCKKEEKEDFIKNTIGNFVEEYVLTEFDLEKLQRKEAEKRREKEATTGEETQVNTIPHEFVAGIVALKREIQILTQIVSPNMV